MKPIDKSALFSIFEAGDEQIYEQHGEKAVMENPFVLLGMVMNGLESYYLMDLMYKRNYPKEYVEVRGNLQQKYYNKLYGYLTKIDIDNFSSQYKVSQAYDLDGVFFVLDHLRQYFERKEQYEKCILIKKYIDLVIDQVNLDVKNLI